MHHAALFDLFLGHFALGQSRNVVISRSGGVTEVVLTES